jgi:hypothetical protein
VPRAAFSKSSENEQKNKGADESAPSFWLSFGLLFYDRTGRARSSAGTAAKARIRVDLVLLLALSDRTNRALTGASAALYTTVIDYKCH